MFRDVLLMDLPYEAGAEGWDHFQAAERIVYCSKSRRNLHCTMYDIALRFKYIELSAPSPSSVLGGEFQLLMFPSPA